MDFKAGVISGGIAERSQIPKEYIWSSEDLYSCDADWERDYKEVSGLAQAMSVWKGTLAQGAEKLLGFLTAKDDLKLRYDRVFSYSERKTHEDTTNPRYQDYYNKAISLAAQINGCTAFGAAEILCLPQQKLEEFYSAEEKLTVYKHHIDEIRRRSSHTLSEEAESLLAQAEGVFRAPTGIMATFTNADLKFEDVTDENGEKAPLTLGRYTSFLTNKNEEVRKQAFKGLHSVLAAYQNTSAAIYNAHVGQMLFNAKARNYSSSLEASLDANNVPVNIYTNLIDTVKGNIGCLHRYMALRKKLLGLTTQHIYDLSLPLVANYSCNVPFEQAKDTVEKALAPLGEEYLEVLKSGFRDRWIDVYENKGKFGGAYSTGSAEHPFVMLNYKNTFTDQFILAHEMGHAIHSWFSAKNQPAVYSDYVIFVAEVASTCNEALLMDYLLGKTGDKTERAYLINYFLEQFKGTFFRQVMLAEFEMRTHQLAWEGKTLTAEVLNDLYYQLNCEYFGPDTVIERDIAVEWSKIPHLYYNFYVYQYATGYAAAMALSRKILAEGKPAVDRYLEFLSGGCSAAPADLLKEAGIDMTTAEPITQALQVFEKLIDELDSLLGQ